MFSHQRIISFIISVIATTFTVVVLLYGSKLKLPPYWIGLLLVYFFIVAAITSWILSKTIYKELDVIKDRLLPFKKKEEDPKKNFYIDNISPIEHIKYEIDQFAKQKHREIEELKKLETFRREFLADVSHELKTPIFAAQGFVHTLLDGDVDSPELRERFLNKAANSLDKLNVLVEDLITISQMEIGEIKMHPQNFDLRKLLEDIFDQLEETAQKRGTRLKIFKYAPKSCYVFADKLRIGQVLTNLVVNAIKYGNESGTIVVNYTIDQESVTISVKDDGPGIEEKHLNRIFERFYRIDKSRSKEQGGTGLGLAIVKHIIEAHESKITVRSKMGEGTTFQFTLKKGKVINS
jgi:two-component system phosphate regulon sensor histidine kinase PhoR